MDKLCIGVISMTSTADYDRNVSEAVRWVKQAASAGCDWVVLPEMFSYMGPYEELWNLSQSTEGPLWKQLAELSRQLGVVLVAGSLMERPETDSVSDIGHKQVYNTLAVFNRSEGLVATYRKVHLFNLRDVDSPFNESQGFLAGNTPSVTVIDGWKVGLSICYDLRFPELYAALSKNGPLDMILAPSAFTYQTGSLHWEVLLRARAIEWQCPVVAANQVGFHHGNKRSFGHSMVVDASGAVLANSREEVGVKMASISQKNTADTRWKIPALDNRRGESIY